MEIDRIERRPKAYHEQVRQNYLAQVRAMPDRYRVVNADRSAEEVHKDVLAAVDEMLKASENTVEQTPTEKFE